MVTRINNSYGIYGTERAGWDRNTRQLATSFKQTVETQFGLSVPQAESRTIQGAVDLGAVT